MTMPHCPTTAFLARPRRHPPRQPRRGLAILIVLALLAMALGVSYALMQMQLTSGQIGQNQTRRLSAHQAALAGISAALRQIHQSDWEGVEVPLAGRLSPLEGFLVTFRTGDDSLQPGDPDYKEFPYRLTITSTGYAADPADPQLRVEHQIQVVVQLVRRALTAEPAGWQQLQQYTVYQWSGDKVPLQLPVHIAGPVLLGGQLELCKEYPDDDKARWQYLSDLEAMRQAGQPDWRPLSGPVYLDVGRTKSQTIRLLRDALGVQLHRVAGHPREPVGHPGIVSTYRLYPGGKQYVVPNVQRQWGRTLAGVTLQPDPLDNPLGLFWTDGDLNLKSHVTIRGTLIGPERRGDINLLGDRIRFEAVDLPPLAGSSAAVQLPVLIHRDDLRVRREARHCRLQGMALVWDKLDVESGPQSVGWEVTGQLVVNQIHVHGRFGWDLGADRWRELLDDFGRQQAGGQPASEVPFFPQWVERQAGLAAKPLLTVGPNSSGVTVHWHDWSRPLFVPHPDDPGLRWDLIHWQDNP